jgi:uncharacterized membrane protein
MEDMPSRNHRSDYNGSSNYRLPNKYARHLLNRLAERRQVMGTFRARANEKRSRSERMADGVTRYIGTVPFLMFHIVLVIAWLAGNLGVLSIPKFDPYPFNFLDILLALEQTFLAIFIIMSQNRSSEIADLRNEIDLQINMLAEEEISKALQMLHLIGAKLGIEEIINDPELPIMEQSLDHSEMEKQTAMERDAAPSPIVTATDWVELS